jgi:hypothetical protein
LPHFGIKYLKVGIGLGLVGALACYLRWLIRSVPIPITPTDALVLALVMSIPGAGMYLRFLSARRHAVQTSAERIPERPWVLWLAFALGVLALALRRYLVH